MAVFGFLKRGLSADERAEINEYLDRVGPNVEAAEREFGVWMDSVARKSPTLSLDSDPDGQHASIYLWRVGEPARDFVQTEPVRSARAFYQAFSLCLEARGAAADAFRVAAERAAVKEASAQVAEANRKLSEAERERSRAEAALADLEARAGRK
jgi:hypothetical protein